MGIEESITGALSPNSVVSFARNNSSSLSISAFNLPFSVSKLVLFALISLSLFTNSIFCVLRVLLNFDVEKFRDTHYSKIDRVANSLSSIFDSRNHIEKILWIRYDPEKRADGIKEEYGLPSEVLTVYFLNTNHSISDPNFILVKENSAWKVFKWD